MEKNENKIVDVIATSDMHSHFLNGDYGSNIYRAGTYVNEARKNNENIILLDLSLIHISEPTRPY